jgi:hypothetical protein
VCFVFVCLFVVFLFLLLDWKSKMMATARQSFNIIHNEKNIFLYETKLSVYRKSKMVTTIGKLFTEKNLENLMLFLIN